MALLTKPRIVTINVVLIVIVTILFFIADSNSSKEDICYNEIDSLYEGVFDLQHRSERAFSDRNWMYTLSIMKQIDENEKWEENYKEDAREFRDKGNDIEAELFDVYRTISNKKIDCRAYSTKADMWRSWAFVVILIQFVLSLIFIGRTQWGKKGKDV